MQLPISGFGLRVDVTDSTIASCTRPIDVPAKRARFQELVLKERAAAPILWPTFSVRTYSGSLFIGLHDDGGGCACGFTIEDAAVSNLI